MIQNFRLKPEQQQLLSEKMMQVNKELITQDKHPWTPQQFLHEVFGYIEYAYLDINDEKIKFRKRDTKNPSS